MARPQKIVQVNADRELRHLEDQVASARAARDFRQEAFLQNQIGNVYESLGKWQKALDAHKLDAKLSRAQGWMNGLALALMNVGKCLKMLGHFGKAKSNVLEMLNIATEQDDLAHQQRACCELGNIYVEEFQSKEDEAADDGKGNVLLKEAKEFYRRSLQLAERLEDSAEDKEDMVLSAYNNMGLVHDLLLEKKQALEWYNRHLQRSKQLGDDEAEARVCYNMGLIYIDLSQHAHALESFERHLEINIRLKNVEEQVDGTSAIVNALCALGKFEEAKSKVQHVQKLLVARAGDAARKQKIDDLMDDVRIKLKKNKEIQLYRRKLDSFDYNTDTDKLRLMIRLADGMKELERPTREIALVYREGMNLIDDDATFSAKTDEIGIFLRNYGNFLEDNEDFREALEIRRREINIPNLLPKDQAFCLFSLGNIQDSLAAPLDEVVEAYRRALLLAEAVGDKELQARICNNIALAYEKSGRDVEAKEFGRRSEELYDSVAVTAVDERSDGDLLSSPVYGDASSDLDYDEKIARPVVTTQRLKKRSRAVSSSSSNSSDNSDDEGAGRGGPDSFVVDLVSSSPEKPVPTPNSYEEEEDDDVDEANAQRRRPTAKKQRRSDPAHMSIPAKIDRQGEATVHTPYNLGPHGSSIAAKRPSGKNGAAVKAKTNTSSQQQHRLKRKTVAASQEYHGYGDYHNDNYSTTFATTDVTTSNSGRNSPVPFASFALSGPPQSAPVRIAPGSVLLGADSVIPLPELLQVTSLPLAIQTQLQPTTTLLSLRHHDLAPPALQKLLVRALDAQPNLKSLHLMHCKLGDDFVQQLLVSSVFSRLHDLDLSSNSITASSLAALAQTVKGSSNRALPLQTLVLSGNYLAAAQTEDLLDLLSAPMLAKLCVARASLVHRATSTARVHTQHLVHLDVSGNTKLDVGPLLRAITAPRLTHLFVGGCAPAFAAELFRALVTFSASLQTLDLRHVSLGQPFFDSLQRLPLLRDLTVAFCQVDDQKFSRMVNAIASPGTLTAIDARGNAVQSALVVTNALAKLPHLKALNLEHCPVGIELSAVQEDRRSSLRLSLSKFQ